MKTKVSEVWELTCEGDALLRNEYKINVEIIDGRGLIITTGTHDEKFWFRYSDPEVVRAIGKLLIEAADLVKEEV